MSTYLAHRVDSTTYQDMTVMEIFESIFADYGAGGTLKSGTLNPLWRLLKFTSGLRTLSNYLQND